MLISSYLELHEFLSDESLQYIGRLSNEERDELKTLLNMMQDFESVSRALEKKDNTLSSARTLFDDLISKYGISFPEMIEYLGSSSRLDWFTVETLKME